MQVSVIVLTWNGKRHLERCLPALAAQTWAGCEIVVVDNGSTDGSGGWVAAHHPSVRLIRNETNRGFAAAVNQGIRATSGEFVVTLNDDTVVRSGWLKALVEPALGHDRVGMCASKMLQAQDTQLIDAAGIEVDWAGIAWNRWRGDPVGAHADAAPAAVFGPCAGAALYRRAMLDEIGLFDEDFFAYYEDVDLAWRAQRAGWRCLYVPGAALVHLHSATGGRLPKMKRYWLGRNKLWTILKNYPSRWLWLCWPVIVAYDVGAILLGLARDGDLAALSGRLDALREWKKFWQKRAIPAGRPAPLAPLKAPWAALAEKPKIDRAGRSPA